MNIDRSDGIYYCINNGFSSSLGLICNECYYLSIYLQPASIFGDYFIIHDKNGMFLGTHKLSNWQIFSDYFISQAEWREQQIKLVLDE